MKRILSVILILLIGITMGGCNSKEDKTVKLYEKYVESSNKSYELVQKIKDDEEFDMETLEKLYEEQEELFDKMPDIKKIKELPQEFMDFQMEVSLHNITLGFLIIDYKKGADKEVLKCDINAYEIKHKDLKDSFDKIKEE